MKFRVRVLSSVDVGNTFCENDLSLSNSSSSTILFIRELFNWRIDFILLTFCCNNLFNSADLRFFLYWNWVEGLIIISPSTPRPMK